LPYGQSGLYYFLFNFIFRIEYRRSINLLLFILWFICGSPKFERTGQCSLILFTDFFSNISAVCFSWWLKFRISLKLKAKAKLYWQIFLHVKFIVENALCWLEYCV
jgi:hypothetical protein